MINFKAVFLEVSRQDHKHISSPAGTPEQVAYNKRKNVGGAVVDQLVDH
jgi:hypothetical protein